MRCSDVRQVQIPRGMALARRHLAEMGYDPYFVCCQPRGERRITDPLKVSCDLYLVLWYNVGRVIVCTSLEVRFKRARARSGHSQASFPDASSSANTWPIIPMTSYGRRGELCDSRNVSANVPFRYGRKDEQSNLPWRPRRIGL
jgi:hypothetical protein